MLMTQKQLEALAEQNGYEDYRGYADDYELKRCDTCHKWGKWGDEIIESETDAHCEKCEEDVRIVAEDDWKRYDHADHEAGAAYYDGLLTGK